MFLINKGSFFFSKITFIAQLFYIFYTFASVIMVYT